MNKELDDIVSYIKSTSNYKKCILIKEKMSKNQEICKIIEEIKRLQKLYVKSNYMNQDIKIDLDNLEKNLMQIPIYVEYMRSLEEVNKMIDFIRDDINSYFYGVFNEK